MGRFPKGFQQFTVSSVQFYFESGKTIYCIQKIRDEWSRSGMHLLYTLQVCGAWTSYVLLGAKKLMFLLAGMPTVFRLVWFWIFVLPRTDDGVSRHGRLLCTKFYFHRCSDGMVYIIPGVYLQTGWLLLNIWVEQLLWPYLDQLCHLDGMP